MTLDLWQIDAFTGEPFHGNPAAVCFLDHPRADTWMQRLAMEMNLSETAFLLPETGGFGLRWFTPGLEVDLCGHATLASAHYLWESGRLPEGDTAQFHTRSGPLGATRDDGWVTLNFPATPAQPLAPVPPTLLAALGVTATLVARNADDILVVVEDAASVRALDPDMELLASVGARGIIVTAPTDLPDADFISRFFAPAAGVPEDPVTGSAHCTLGPYWAARLGRTALIGYQASARGGYVQVEVGTERVMLRGQAVTILRGTLAPEAL